MRVGYHAPLPPARTGVADYAQALLDALRAYCDVVPNAGTADVHLYQLGNNQLHRSIYERAISHPGVVLLHDANLHHFYLGALGREAYLDEFCKQYGSWYRSFALQLWDRRALSAGDERYFRYPMLRTAIQSATTVIVHNAAAAAIVAAHGVRCPVIELPHLFSAPRLPADYEVLALRYQLGLSGSDYLFGVFGHLRESKRLGCILRAYHKARSKDTKIRLGIAGQFVSSTLEQSLMPSAAVLRIPGILPEQDFWKYAQAIDACINLRYPSCGETSGIAIRMMGIGKPVLMTAGEELAAFPWGSYVPIDTGLGEEAHVEEWMLSLARFRKYGKEIGDLARRHIRREHAAPDVAQRLYEVLNRLQ